MSKRATWARNADRLAEWFGINQKGTTISGKARLAFRDAIVESRTVLRSGAMNAAGKTKAAGKRNSLPWIHVLFSKHNPNTIAIIVDKDLGGLLLKSLSWALTTGTFSADGPATDSERLALGTPTQKIGGSS